MSYRKTTLSAAIVMCLGVAAQAHAQDSGAAAPAASGEQASELDRVVVTGIRGSLQQALDTKRNADAIVDVITAEDVGKFPATNVAEAMTIIPGVTIDRLFGQGEKVSILGTDPALNRTLLNGQTVASADWFIVDQPGRTFNYSLLAPQIVGKVEVYKSPEAHIEEGSIGGTVIVSTRKPLDQTEKFLVSGQVSSLYNDRVQEFDPQGSVMLGWKNASDTFGVIVSAQTSTENIRRDGVEAYGTITAIDYRDGRDGGGGSVNNVPIDWSVGSAVQYCVDACEAELETDINARGPNSLSASYFEQERKRDTYSVALQFKPTENFEVEFNALRVDASYDNMNQSMFAFMGNAYNSLMKLTDVTIDNGVITKASFHNALLVYDLQNRLAEVDTDSYDLRAKFDNDKFFVSGTLGTTKATGGTSKQVFGEFLARADYSYDISGAPQFPGKVTFPGANPFLDPSAFRMDGGWGSDPNSAATWNTGWGGNVVFKPNHDEEKYGQLDFGLRFDSPLYQLRFGVKRREHETGQVMGGVSLASVQGYGDAPASMFNPRPVPGNYLNGFTNTGDLSGRFTIDGWALADYILSNQWLAPWQSPPVPSTFNDPSFAANTWTINEDVNAAYVQADFSYERLRGNIGVRYVETESESASFACVVTTDDPPCPADGYAPVSVTKKYDNLLPNVNLVYDLTDEWVLRFSAAKVMARPNFGQMSSYLWLGDQTLTGGGGNPNLDPYRSTNLDFSAEWYFSENAILAGTVFYKDITDYVLETTRPETHFNQSTGASSVYQISRPDNAGNAKIKGISLAWQYNFNDAFGLVTNYTYSDGKSDTGDPLPYNSQNQFNVSPFFETDDWTARITYSHRSKYFTNVDRGDNLWTRAYDSVDASVAYNITDNFSVGLEAMNLLDEAYQSYATTERLPRGMYRSGRRYMASLRFQF